MVKGVNKQIIEVKNPDSVYFEKVVFYLKSGVNILPDEISSREIDKYIENVGYKRKKSSFNIIAIVIISAIVIAVIFAILC
ncbi:MAG: hypothetical protein K2K91_08860 [Ruminococcus sp.]|nr:hypothetical protein [Ruminococcus sp.]MDE7099067.1 hypothetical protein [Ruminococcus sp.]